MHPKQCPKCKAQWEEHENIYEYFLRQGKSKEEAVIKSFKDHSGDCFAVLSSGIILDFHDEAESFLWQSEHGAVLKAYA